MCQVIMLVKQPVSIVNKDNDYREEGLGFDSQVGQIRHSVSNGSPPLRCSFRAVLLRR